MDNFGDSRDNCSGSVDKWGKNDVMSCCTEDLCMSVEETYPHIHRVYPSLAICFRKEESLH